MSAGIDRAALVRDHLQAFNARDLERSIAGLSETVVWRTGTDVVVGRAAVEAFLGDAMRGLLPTLQIRSLVAGQDLVACELEERYRHDGADHHAAIAAFFRFSGEQISEVKVYREGSADP
jgi:nuclear transport factor 2 (NTF2) superfamily protein